MPPRNRPNTNTDDVVLMVTDPQVTEQLSEVFLQANSSAAKEAALDGRAQSFAVGRSEVPSTNMPTT